MVIAARVVISKLRERSPLRVALRTGSLCLLLAVLACGGTLLAWAQTEQPANQPPGPDGQSTTSSPPAQSNQNTGVITGTVTDKEGALAVGAQVTLIQTGRRRTPLCPAITAIFRSLMCLPDPFV